jgi:hypothetical protein
MKMPENTPAEPAPAPEALTEEQRHRLVQVAAYYIAQSRNFQNGDPVEDWRQAEREIDRLAGTGDDRA